MGIMFWSKTWKEYFFSSSMKRSDVLLILFAVFFLSFGFTFKMPFHESVQGKTEIALGYSAKQGENGLYYVLDNGHERLVCFDEAGEIRFVIKNPSDSKSDLLYIDDFCVSDDGIYLSVTEWGEMCIVREAVLFYTEDGRYVNTVLERDYSDGGTDKHRFYGISERNGEVQVAECLANSILINGFRILYPNAFHAVSDVIFVDDTVYVLNKNGTIRIFADGNRNGEVIYSLSGETDKNVVPYRLAADGEGNIYFTDIRNRVVRRVDTRKGTSKAVYGKTDSLTVHFAEDGAFLLMDGRGLHVVGTERTRDYFSLKKNIGMILFQLVWLATVAASIISCLVAAIRLLSCFFRKKRSITQLVAFWVVITVTAVSILLCGLLMSAFEERYREKIEEQVESAAYMVANQISGSNIDRIEETGGFGGEAYNRLCMDMKNAFTGDIAFYRQLYCNILKFPKDGGDGYAVAYLDQSIGAYFPLNAIEQKELRAVYETGEAVWNEEVADISGTYLSVKVPVWNDDGTVSGAVAVGVETYVITDTLRKLIVGILMSVIIILMLVYLISVEVMSAVSNYGTFQKEVSEKKTDVLPGHLIRALVFLIFASYNMTATFLPVYLMRETDIFPEQMREVVGALPITINIFIIGVMSLFCAKLVRKYGIRKIMPVSIVCSLAGNLLIYMVPGFYAICAGLALDGIGVGMLTNAIYVLLTYISEDGSRTWGLTIYNSACLSGINFGMILGSLLAVTIGQRMVFGVAALAWLVMTVLSGYVLRKMEGIFTAAREGEKEKKSVRRNISAKDFIWNKQVIGFVALIQNPYIIFGSFLFYYVPIFCDEGGYSETICSLLIMLYSQAAVLCADKLTKWFSKTLGNYAIYAALYMNVAALAVFAALPDMRGMVVTLFLMGLGASYGKTVQQNYYLGLEKTKQYGEDRSMGIYNFSENIGESLGPVVFGRIMAAARFTMAVGVFCSVTAGLGLIHYLVCGKEFRDEKSGKV